MDFNKLTLKSQEAIAAAQELARRNGNPELYPEHLLIALLDQDLPRRLVPDADALRAQADAALTQKPSIAGAQQQPQLSSALANVLDKAEDEAKRMQDEFVSTEHLLLALDVVPRDALLEKLEQVRGGQRVTSQDPEGTYEALAKFGRDLTEAAEQGKLDPVIGRDEEIRRVIQRLTTELGLNLAGVELVLRLEDELRKAHEQIERLQKRLAEEVQNVHKQYRRDLVLYREERLPERS